MSFEDLLRYFYCVNITFIRPPCPPEKGLVGKTIIESEIPRWFESRRSMTYTITGGERGERREGEALADGEADAENELCVNTPYYVLTLLQPSEYTYVSVHQKIIENLYATPYIDFGIIVLRIVPSMSPKGVYQLITATGNINERQNQTDALSLEAGQYLIIPTSTGSSLKVSLGNFNMSDVSSCQSCGASVSIDINAVPLDADVILTADAGTDIDVDIDVDVDVEVEIGTDIEINADTDVGTGAIADINANIATIDVETAGNDIGIEAVINVDAITNAHVNGADCSAKAGAVFICQENSSTDQLDSFLPQQQKQALEITTAIGTDVVLQNDVKIKVLSVSNGEEKFNESVVNAYTELFHRLDIDNDGFLNREELEYFITLLEGTKYVLHEDDYQWFLNKFHSDIRGLSRRGFIDCQLLAFRENRGTASELLKELHALGFRQMYKTQCACNLHCVTSRRAGIVLHTSSPHDLKARPPDGHLSELAVELALTTYGVKHVLSCCTMYASSGGKTSNLISSPSGNKGISFIVTNTCTTSLRFSLDCTGSVNILSHRGLLQWVEEIPAGRSKVLHHLRYQGALSYCNNNIFCALSLKCLFILSLFHLLN